MKRFKSFKTKEEAIEYLKQVLKWKKFIKTHRKLKLAIEYIIK